MRLTNLLRTTVSAAVVGACAFGFAGVASAQDRDGAQSIDDIIVTAQKREQNLQDVPIVVTTLSETLLEDAGVRDIKDLQILTPGLIVTSTTNESVTTARIRGVGTVSDNPGIESSVGIVIDGVYRSRNGVGFGDLGQLSRIEVLKGPQGTLFGKNTSSGVINIISEAPSFNPEFEGEITGGSNGAFGIAGSITGPLSEQVAGRLYVASRLRDGFYNVNTAGGPRTENDDGKQDFNAVRGQLLILPSDATSIRLIADFTERSEYCCVAPAVFVGPTGAIVDSLVAGSNGVPGPAYGAQPFSRTAFANRGTAQFVTDMGLSAEVNHDISSWDAAFTSITAWRSWETINGMDLDFSGADMFYRLPDGAFSFGLDQVSQEFRLAGSTDSFDWLVGAFISREDLKRNDSFLFGSAAAPFLSIALGSQAGAPAANLGTFLACVTAATPANVNCATAGFIAPVGGGQTIAAGSGYNDRYSQASDSVALFTNNSWRATEQLEFTLGLRYTRETKRMNTFQDNIGGNGAVCTAARLNPVLAAGPANGLLGGGLCINQANPDFDGRTYTQNFEDDDVSGRFAAQYRFNPSLMVYASAARGFKAGGFNLERSSAPISTTNSNPIPVNDTSFASETVDSYEIGFKSTLFDRSLLFNMTAFDQTYTDFQLNTFAGINFIVESIPELNSRGADMDFFWFTPVEGLSLQGGVTYTDSTFGVFTAADLTVPSRFAFLSLLPGNTIAFAPEWSATTAISFDRSIGMGLRAGFNLSAKYSTEYNTGSDLLPIKVQEAFTLVNGQISIGSENENWTVDVWAQNLTDEEYNQVVFNTPLQSGSFNAFRGAPRTYGATLRLKY